MFISPYSLARLEIRIWNTAPIDSAILSPFYKDQVEDQVTEWAIKRENINVESLSVTVLFDREKRPSHLTSS